MMKYCIAKFKRYLPTMDGFKQVASFDNYTLFSITEEALPHFPSDVEYEEVTELEGTVAWKFYGEARPYRSAYSDVEGLEPDPESLAEGKRKTKVHYTAEIYNATVALMKRIFKRNILDVYAEREDQTGKEEIISLIDSLTTVKDISYHRERLLGTEMSKTQLKELGLWDDSINSRIGRHQFTTGF